MKKSGQLLILEVKNWLIALQKQKQTKPKKRVNPNPSQKQQI